MKKILTIIFCIIIFSACSTISKQYKYKAIEKIENLSIVGMIEDIYSENSNLSYIRIYHSKNWDGKNRKLKLLNDTVKLIKEGKEYIIPYSNSNNYEDIYISIYENRINITDGDFTAYIGKIQLDTGEIVEIPPLHFKKYISIEKYNVILDTLNQDANRKSFSGTLEEYKKNGWKEE